MNYRRWAQIAEGSLLAIVLVVHVALLAGRQRWLQQSFGQLGIVLADAVPMAQIALLALWATIGPGRTWLRLAYTLPIAGLCAIWWWSGWDYGAEIQMRWIFGGAAAIIGVVGAILALAGWRLRDAGLAASASGSQFSIRSLFIVTTLFAVVIGGLEAARPWLQTTPVESWSSYPPLQVTLIEPSYSYQSRLWLAQGMIAAIGLVMAWAMLRPGMVWLRLLAVAFCVPLAGWYEDHLTGASPEFATSIAAWNVVFALLVACSLVPIRLMNFRLYRPSNAAIVGGEHTNPKRQRGNTAFDVSPSLTLFEVALLICSPPGLPGWEPVWQPESAGKTNAATAELASVEPCLTASPKHGSTGTSPAVAR